MATFVEGRKLRLTAVSACYLPDHRITDRMKVYCKISLNEQAESINKSKSDKKGGVNPTWNFTVDYTVTEPAVQLPGANLVVKLYCKRSLTKDKRIGEVRIPINTLFDKGLKSHNLLSYRVEGTQYGRLNIHYSFGDKIAVPVVPPARASAARRRFLSGGGITSLVNIGFLLVKLSSVLLPGGNLIGYLAH